MVGGLGCSYTATHMDSCKMVILSDGYCVCYLFLTWVLSE